MIIYNYKLQYNKDLLPQLVRQDTGLTYEHEHNKLSLKVFVELANVIGLQNSVEEYLYLITLNAENNISGFIEVSHGSKNSTFVDCRSIALRLLLSGATICVLLHNHPSNNTSPSEQDDKATTRVKQLCKDIDITFLDHIIVGRDNYYSYAEHSKI